MCSVCGSLIFDKSSRYFGMAFPASYQEPDSLPPSNNRDNSSSGSESAISSPEIPIVLHDNNDDEVDELKKMVENEGKVE